ncbi:transcription factor MYB1R1-like [Lycium ferocissimum]|uniref:transcription factor MYB1R1-like n=1 Tax=Lycium ferocissimum TaxID=112874 RepID=UPI002814FE00|nr:transcription factor MYB1R1-like [Lycium ferocissimum]
MSSSKGRRWSEDDQRAFLIGLDNLGKGNWTDIARDFVPSRTPTQYFVEKGCSIKEKQQQRQRTFESNNSNFRLSAMPINYAYVPMTNYQFADIASTNFVSSPTNATPVSSQSNCGSVDNLDLTL